MDQQGSVIYVVEEKGKKRSDCCWIKKFICEIPQVLIRFWMRVCKVDHVSERLVQTWHHSSFVSVDFHHHHTWVKDDNKECVPDFKTLQACFHIWTRHSFYCQQIVEGLRGYTPLNRAVFSLQFSLEMWQVSSYKQHSVLCNTGSLHQCGYKKEGGRVRKTSHECSPCTRRYRIYVLTLWELFLFFLTSCAVWNCKNILGLNYVSVCKDFH